MKILIQTRWSNSWARNKISLCSLYTFPHNPLLSGTRVVSACIYTIYIKMYIYVCIYLTMYLFYISFCIADRTLSFAFGFSGFPGFVLWSRGHCYMPVIESIHVCWFFTQCVNGKCFSQRFLSTVVVCSRENLICFISWYQLYTPSDGEMDLKWRWR